MKSFNLNINSEKLNILNTVLFAVMVITSICSMYLSNDLANKGVHLSEIEDHVLTLEMENDYLSSKYYEGIALQNVAFNAAESGLTKANVDFYTSPSFALR